MRPFAPLLAISLALITQPNTAHSQQLTEEQLRKAIGFLVSDVLDHCHYQFSYTMRRTGDRLPSTGKFVFARLNESYLAERIPDNALHANTKTSATQKPLSGTQIILTNGQKPLSIAFAADAQNKKQPLAVTSMDHLMKDQCIQYLCDLSRIDYLLSAFGPSDIHLRSLVASGPHSVTTGAKSATLNSKYGRFSIVCDTNSQPYSISSLELTQGPPDIYHRVLHQPLSAITKPANMKESAGGLTRGQVTVRLDYSRTTEGAMYLHELRSSQEYANAEGAFGGSLTLHADSFRQIATQAEFDQLTVLIPNGFPVALSSQRAEAGEMPLVWYNGQIVRHISGEALAHGLLPAAHTYRRSLILALAASALTMTIVLGGIQLRRKYRRAS